MEPGMTRSVIMFFLHLTFQLNLRIFKALRWCMWSYCGILAERQQARKPENYHRSAHVLDIWLRFKLDEIMQASSLNDFFLTHAGFEDPHEILLRPDVSLCNISEEEAIFVQVDGGIDITDHDVESFINIAQFKRAKRVITVPRNSFIKASESLQLPNNIVFICNTGRCGSTLMMQYFQTVPRCLTISEPDVLNSISQMYMSMKSDHFHKTVTLGSFSNKVPTEDLLKSLTTASLKFMCNVNSKDHFFVKIQVPSMVFIPCLRKNIPGSKFLFMYRDLLVSSKSLVKVSKMLPIEMLTLLILNYSESAARWMWGLTGQPAALDSFFQPGISNLTKLAEFVILTSNAYVSLMKDGFPIQAVKYEHWVAKPEENTARMLDYLELPVDWVQYVGPSFKKDSQRESVLSRKRLENIQEIPVDSISVELINKRCEEFQLPTLNEEYILPGTLTHA